MNDKKILLAAANYNYTVKDIGDYLGIRNHIGLQQLALVIDRMIDKGMLSNRNGLIEVNKTWMRRHLFGG